MAEEQASQVGAENQTNEQASASQDDKTVSELERARREAASYRTKLRETEAKLKEAEPVLAEYQKAQDAQKSEAQKAAERAQAAEAKVQAAEAKAQRAERVAIATRLAAKAGVDPDIVPYLDVDKLDLDDEKKALDILGKLASAKGASAGGASNPGRSGASGTSDDELRKLYFGGGGNRPTIFGGN